MQDFYKEGIVAESSNEVTRARISEEELICVPGSLPNTVAAI